VTKLFVGNLPCSATEQSVRALFEPFGTIESIVLINDRETGRPRGFGFIEMSNSDASHAIQALNGKDFDGRSLKVNEAQSKERGGGGGYRASGGNRLPTRGVRPYPCSVRFEGSSGAVAEDARPLCLGAGVFRIRLPAWRL
jgi:RNA recognition motif-containing protein